MENTKESCIICFEENQEKILFDCNHSICLFCYSKLLENDNVICPICRKIIDIPVKPKCSCVAIPIPVHNAPNLIIVQRDRMGWKGIFCLISVMVIVIITLVSVMYKSH